MLVPVIAVPRVQMTVVQIVDVVAMGHRRVAALRSVLMGVFGVFDARIGRTFVPMIVVLMVSVAVVDVVDVVVVNDGDMATVGPVHVGMVVVSM